MKKIVLSMLFMSNFAFAFQLHSLQAQKPLNGDKVEFEVKEYNDNFNVVLVKYEGTIKGRIAGDEMRKDIAALKQSIAGKKVVIDYSDLQDFIDSFIIIE